MKSELEVCIGLEIHVELATQSKIFCGCKNKFGAKPNTLCCPVCTGMPGALPVLNQKVVEYAIKMGYALDCRINPVSSLSRKHYFYPDLPKGYQITQAETPLCENGRMEILVEGECHSIGIVRVHIEEDAGKLIHFPSDKKILVDYNRSGVPLIEIVSAPDLHSAEQAKIFMENIALVLRYIDISDVKMQEGSLRADVNVSLRPLGQIEHSNRTEMKNINSFAAVQRAITHEVERQKAILYSGKTVKQETRRWDDLRGESHLMRTKAQDYFYFPEPELLPFEVSLQKLQQIRKQLPELPTQKIRRYRQEYGLSAYDSRLLAEDAERAIFFDAAMATNICTAKTLANWILGDVLQYLNETGASLANTALTPSNLAQLGALAENKTISGATAKQVLGEIMLQDISPHIIVQQRGLAQLNDPATLEAIVQKVLAGNPKAVIEYKAGKTNILGFLAGKCIQETDNKGNPQLLKKILERYLS